MWLTVLCMVAATGQRTAQADETAAHAIADRFAAEPDRKAQSAADKKKKRDAEAARLAEATARAEAEKSAAARVAAAAKAAELQRKLAAAERRAADARRKAEAARERAEIARREAYEREMLARARAEAAEAKKEARETKAAEQRIVVSPPAEETAQPVTKDAPTVADEPAITTTAADNDPNLKALAKQRQAESDTLAEKLRRAREAHSAINGQDAEPDPFTAPISVPEKASEPLKSPTAISAFPEQRTPNGPSPVTTSLPTDGSITHATILLVMKPGKKGIRRWKKTADPMLCFDKYCYISRGKALPAQRITRRRGFGPGIALGKRAGACSNSLTCVFRDVQLARDGPSMQPIDLRVIRHDRRKRRNVKADRSCNVKRGRLACRVRVEARDWSAWIVPERLAKRAGPSLLHAALETGLTVSTTKASR